MSDYDKEVLTASALLSRLDAIETTLKLNTDKDWYPRPGDFIYLVDGDHVLRLDKIEMDIERIGLRLSKLEEDRHGTD